jgi:N6-L-threonylcarbamoyladenine synthase
MLRERGFEFSFAGLKTAVALEAARLEREGAGELSARAVADLAASFQEAVADVLVHKTRQALLDTGLRRLAMVGGLAANSRLRARIAELAGELGVEVRLPPLALCTDNAAMIAAAADALLREGRVAGLDLEAFSRVALEAAPSPR